MKTKSFIVGQLVRVKGKKGTFRYVSKNIVRNIKSGQVHSVRASKIRTPSLFSAYAYTLVYLSIILIAGTFAYGLFKFFTYIALN